MFLCVAWFLYVIVVWTVVLLIVTLVIVIALSTNSIISLIPISMWVFMKLYLDELMNGVVFSI